MFMIHRLNHLLNPTLNLHLILNELIMYMSIGETGFYKSGLLMIHKNFKSL